MSSGWPKEGIKRGARAIVVRQTTVYAVVHALRKRRAVLLRLHSLSYSLPIFEAVCDDAQSLGSRGMSPWGSQVVERGWWSEFLIAISSSMIAVNSVVNALGLDCALEDIPGP